MPYALPHQVTPAERAARQTEITTAKSTYKYSTTVGRGQHIRSPSSIPTPETFPKLTDNSTGTTDNYSPHLNSATGKFFANLIYHASSATASEAQIRADTLGDLLALEDQLADDPTLENVTAYYNQLHSIVTSAGTTGVLSEYLDMYKNWSAATDHL